MLEVKLRKFLLKWENRLMLTGQSILADQESLVNHTASAHDLVLMAERYVAYAAEREAMLSLRLFFEGHTSELALRQNPDER